METKKERRYGTWAGNPKGWAEDKSRCVKDIYSSDAGSHGHQCSRKRGFGPNGEYCKIHNPEYIKLRDEEKREEWENKYQKSKEHHERAGILNTLAEGIPTEELKEYKLVKKDQ